MFYFLYGVESSFGLLGTSTGILAIATFFYVLDLKIGGPDWMSFHLVWHLLVGLAAVIHLKMVWRMFLRANQQANQIER